MKGPQRSSIAIDSADATGYGSGSLNADKIIVDPTVGLFNRRQPCLTSSNSMPGCSIVVDETSVCLPIMCVNRRDATGRPRHLLANRSHFDGRRGSAALAPDSAPSEA